MNCRVCGSDRVEALRGYESAFLVRCRKCECVFADPLPTGQELEEHYAHKYENKYRKESWTSDVTRKRLVEIVGDFEIFRESGRMLDVGCGKGLLLESAKKQGWECYGTEYSEDALALGREQGFTMHRGELSEDTYPAGFFDVIVMTEVIEHLTDPFLEMEKVVSFLRRGGCLYLTTPNFGSLSRRILGTKWNVIDYPAHLHYFCPRTMALLASRLGCRVQVCETTGISLSRFATSVSKEQHLEIKPSDADEKIRSLLESSPRTILLKRGVNKVLSQLSLGDALKVQFVKA